MGGSESGVSILCLALPALTIIMPWAAAGMQASDADAILGLWSIAADTGEARVVIEREAGRYHGRIVWLENPLVPDGHPSGLAGTPKVDLNNPEPALRSRPIVELEILRGFEYDAEQGVWTEGRVYDPEKGKEYRCTLRLSGDGTLEVHGYVKLGFLRVGRTSYWRRVETPEP